MSGVGGLEYLCVLVVGHRLCGIQLIVEQERHVEWLLYEFTVHGDTEQFDGRGQLELIAVSPRTDPLPSQSDGWVIPESAHETIKVPGPLEYLDRC